MSEESKEETPKAAAPKAKAPAKAKAVSKAKAKPKAKTAKQTDMIADTATKIENLTMDKAYTMVTELSENMDFTYFQLGGVLAVIQSNSWYTDSGFDNFRAFIEEKFGIGYRKAMYMIGIYNGLVESGVAWEKVKSLGWTKLKELSEILTEENVDEWLEIAEDMTVLQLQEYIKQQAKGSSDSSDKAEVEESDKVTTITFKVHGDQKEVITDAVDKAKHDADTEHANVALESICMAYLSGGKPVKGAKAAKVKIPTLTESMEASSWEEVLEVFEKLWPEVQLTAEVE